MRTSIALLVSAGLLLAPASVLAGAPPLVPGGPPPLVPGGPPPLVPGKPPALVPGKPPPLKPPKKPEPKKPEPKKPDETVKKPEPKKPDETAKKPEPKGKSAADRLVLRPPATPLKGGGTTSLSIKILDAASKLTAGEVVVKVDIGTVTSPVEINPGHYACTYAAPDEVPSGGNATVTVEVKNATHPVVATLPIPFAGTAVAVAPKPPERDHLVQPDIVTRTKPARIVFGKPVEIRPGQVAKVHFKVEDDKGRLMSDEGIRLKSEGGEFSNITSEDGGGYVADFIPSEEQRGEVRLIADANGEPLVGSGTVVVAQAGVVPETRRVGIVISGLVGGLTNFGKMATPQFELAVEYQMAKVFRAGVLAGVSPASASGVQETDGVRQANISLTGIPILARAAYTQTVGPVDLAFGGMAGLALVNVKVTADGETHEFKANLLELAGFAGVGVPLGPGSVIGELRMSRIRLDVQDETTQVKGGLGGLSGAVGYQFMF